MGLRRVPTTPGSNLRFLFLCHACLLSDVSFTCPKARVRLLSLPLAPSRSFSFARAALSRKLSFARGLSTGRKVQDRAAVEVAGVGVGPPRQHRFQKVRMTVKGRIMSGRPARVEVGEREEERARTTGGGSHVPQTAQRHAGQGGHETDHVSPSARSSSQQPRDSRRRRCASLTLQVSTRARTNIGNALHTRPISHVPPFAAALREGPRGPRVGGAAGQGHGGRTHQRVDVAGHGQVVDRVLLQHPRKERSRTSRSMGTVFRCDRERKSTSSQRICRGTRATFCLSR